MPGPPRIIVEHATELPARDCAGAGAVATLMSQALHDQPFDVVRLSRPGKMFPQAGAAEHVTADGRLAANSLFWIERALGTTGRLLEAETLSGGSGHPELVALNPFVIVQGSPDERRRIAGEPESVLWLRVVEHGNDLQVLAIDERDQSQDLGALESDPYGRWSFADSRVAAALSLHLGVNVHWSKPSFGPQAVGGTRPTRILILGEEDHLRSVFPAVLAALGDAAETLKGLFELKIASPRGLSEADRDEICLGSDGVVLPGGSDLAQVPGQIIVATAATTHEVPALGLCLGMQTMAVAVARAAGGLPLADLEESNPQATIQLFTRLQDEQGRPSHRLGERQVSLRPDTILARCFGRTETRERLNHRFVLDHQYVEPLGAAGLQVSAVSEDGRIADAVEHTRHPFFVGLQSHPELLSRQRQPHPAILGFLRAAQRRAERAATKTG